MSIGPGQGPIYEGLWFAGAQSEAYGGVTGAMRGAAKAVDMTLH